MAVTVASHNTAYSASGTSLVITKPTGLAVGDLMLAGIRHDNGDGITLPSDWTLLSSTFNPFNNVAVHYKYATSGDVAASNFTWTLASSTVSAGGIIRVTGASPLIGSAILAGAATNTATPSFATGVTPTRSDSLIVIFLFAMTNSNDANGGYAIATSNPALWTEQYDVAMGSDENMTCAWAVRPETTSTGAWSATGGTGTSDYNSFLVSINETLTSTVTESTTLTEVYLNNIAMTKAETSTLTEVWDVDDPTIWTNQTKNSSSWTNQTKN